MLGNDPSEPRVFMSLIFSKGKVQTFDSICNYLVMSIILLLTYKDLRNCADLTRPESMLELADSCSTCL